MLFDGALTHAAVAGQTLDAGADAAAAGVAVRIEDHQDLGRATRKLHAPQAFEIRDLVEVTHRGHQYETRGPGSVVAAGDSAVLRSC